MTTPQPAFSIDEVAERLAEGIRDELGLDDRLRELDLGLTRFALRLGTLERAFVDFTEGRVSELVATDGRIAARVAVLEQKRRELNTTADSTVVDRHEHELERVRRRLDELDEILSTVRRRLRGVEVDVESLEGRVDS